MTKFETRQWEGMDWLWPRNDTELWGGPRADWLGSHRAVIERHCRGFRTVIQAGGACGMYPKLLATLFNRVYTFEPHPDNFYCLVHNCPEHSIVKLQGALGDKHKMVFLQKYFQTNSGSYYVEETPKSIYNHFNPKYRDLANHYIPQFCIDDLDLNQCDLIWLDIEGSEERAIKGAIHTINKFSPMIMLEYGESVGELMSKLDYLSVDTSGLDTVYMRV